MENLFARHKPRRGMVCLTMVGSLVLHGGLVGIASLWTPPQPEPRSVLVDWFAEPSQSGDPLKPIDVPQSAPTESPDATVTPESIDPVATPPPTSSEPDIALPAEPTPPKRGIAVSKPSASVSRPTSGQTGSHDSATSASVGVPGNGNPSGVSAWVMPHPPFPHMIGRPAAVGQTTVRITTDAAGRVSNVVILKSTGTPALDNHPASYVRNNWHGLPNASRTTEFVYEVR